MNKALPTIFVLLFSLFCFSQDDLIGNWYLESFTINGSSYSNVYSNLPINFSQNIVYENYLSFDGNSSCNAFFGEYTYSDNEIIFYGLGETLVDCYPSPNGLYENLYINLLTSSYSYPSEFTFSISGVSDEQILTLTNLNGDILIYRKTETNLTLTRTWYLETIINDDLEYNISSTSSPSITFTNTTDYFFGDIDLNGNGDCNTFTGDYHIYSNNDGDKIQISSFSPTTNPCDTSNNFEAVYFSILGDTSANTFSFEIINNGDHLVLTSVSDVMGRGSNSIGDMMLFGKQPLSIDEFENKESVIKIIKNPVEVKLELEIKDNLLDFDLSYSIYNIEGKKMLTSNLKNRYIDVNYLPSGIYFVSFYNNNQVTTLKFIKK